ncbi:MAG: hypothetical protein QME49_04820 [bacterium]|nr:hypothetical protein [bacterium]
MSIIYQPAGKAREYAEYAVNLYTGCTHGCTYCYVPSVLFKGKDFWEKSVPRKDILKLLRADCEKMQDKIVTDNILLSFTCDVYQRSHFEDDVSITREALEVLNKYKLPFTVLTKGGTLAVKDFDMYSYRDCFATTLTFVDDAKTKACEPKAALFEDRFMAIKEAKSRGIKTWVSLEPVIEPAEAYSIISLTHEYVDFYKVGKINYVRSSIDWRAFGMKVVDMLEVLGKDYYIKQDLRKYMQ